MTENYQLSSNDLVVLGNVIARLFFTLQHSKHAYTSFLKEKRFFFTKHVIFINIGLECNQLKLTVFESLHQFEAKACNRARYHC